jgi:hypothetical protein
MATPDYQVTTDKLFETVSDTITEAGNIARRIGINPVPNLRERRLQFDVDAKNLQEPPKFSDLFPDGNNGGELITQLNDKVDAWLAKYFPSINGQFQNVPEDWLVGVISGVKPFGIDSTVFDLVWHKARDRAYRTTQSEQKTLEANFSGRGFTLPVGALVAAMSDVEQRASEAILDVNRDQAIKDAEIKQDILKYAVGVASELKRGILNTSAEFFKAYYSAYGLDNDVARIRAQAYSAYYNALSTYYGVEVSWEELRLRAATASASTDAEIDRARIAVYAENGANTALAQASRGFNDVAASASSAASSLIASVQSA